MYIDFCTVLCRYYVKYYYFADVFLFSEKPPDVLDYTLIDQPCIVWPFWFDISLDQSLRPITLWWRSILYSVLSGSYLWLAKVNNLPYRRLYDKKERAQAFRKRPCQVLFQLALHWTFNDMIKTASICWCLLFTDGNHCTMSLIAWFIVQLV